MSPRVYQRNGRNQLTELLHDENKIDIRRARPRLLKVSGHNLLLLLGECRTQCKRAARVLATGVIETIVGVFHTSKCVFRHHTQ